MNIFTLGKGFVSSHLPYPVIADRIDCENRDAMKNSIDFVLDKYKPGVIINCIGVTGRPNVDWCESNQHITYTMNASFPVFLANACKNLGIKLIHIGSGCVFYGYDKAWEEGDVALPESFYSKSKYAADLVIGGMDNVSILRIRMPISSKDDDRNILNKLRGYKNIIDMNNSMTFMDDFVRCIDYFVNNDYIGIYHVTNEQPLSAVGLMNEYKKYVPDHQFNIISEGELDKIVLAKRSNCILSTKKLNDIGFYMTESSIALEDTMKQYINNLGIK